MKQLDIKPISNQYCIRIPTKYLNHFDEVTFSISEEYIKYFTWKYEWNVDYRNPICGICERLNDPSEPTSILDLDKEFGNKNCRNAEELPWMISRLTNI